MEHRTIQQAIEYAHKYDTELTYDAKTNTFIDRWGNRNNATCCSSALLPEWSGGKHLSNMTCEICGAVHETNTLRRIERTYR